MGKVKITVNPEQESKESTNSLITSLQEAVVAEDINDRIAEVTKNHVNARIDQLIKYTVPCQCKPQKLDKRLRKYARAVRKQLHAKADVKSLDLVSARIDLQSERLKDLAQSLDAVGANVDGLHDKSDITQLEKEIYLLKHHIELIEQEMKVKPVNIKKETILERFDHRLTLMTILMLFINAFLVMHILTN